MTTGPPEPQRRGIVAVILRGERFLVIRRSRHVRAPLAPFAPEVQVPSEKQALVRPEPLPEDAALIQLPRLNN